MSRSASTSIAVGIALLALGTAVYLIDRPPEVFVPPALSFFEHPEAVFGSFGRSLPSFAHVLAFSLFTAVIIGRGRQAAVMICLGWFLLEAGFELGQHAAAAPLLAGLVPGWFEAIPILDRTPAYFLHGTVDARDLCASALGALSAYLLIRHTHRREEAS